MDIIQEQSNKILVVFDPQEEKREFIKYGVGKKRRKLVYGICPECGQEIYYSPHKKSSLVYCSEQCRLAKHRIKTTCAFCGKNITIKKSKLKGSKHRQYYCDRKCKELDQSLFTGRSKITPKHYKVKREPLCLICGKKLVNNQKKYCSYKCTSLNVKKNNIKRFLNNEYVGKSHLPSSVREYLFEISNNKCSKCGWTAIHSVTGKIPLQIHHKDGNYANNTKSNIEILCPNCHVLTGTYGSLNIGNGRPYHVVKK